MNNKNVVFHQDIARVDTNDGKVTIFVRFGSQWLLPVLKKMLAGLNEEMNADSEAYFATKDLIERYGTWNKTINEKKSNFVEKLSFQYLFLTDVLLLLADPTKHRLNRLAVQGKVYAGIWLWFFEFVVIVIIL